jgi:outer membrane protein assembly factor BamD
MQYISFRFVPLMTLIVMVALAGCSGQPHHDDDLTRHWSAEELYLAAQERMSKADFRVAIEYYEKVISRFPFDLYAQQSQMEVAYAHFRDEEFESAIMAADRFIRMNPTHPYVDYAYYLKGLSHLRRNQNWLADIFSLDTSQRCQAALNDAFKEFKALLVRFPESRYANDARRKMATIRDDLAHREVSVARFYLERGAPVAAVARAKYVIENFSQSHWVEEALGLLAESYLEMASNDLYRDTCELIQLNYPDRYSESCSEI